MQKKGGNRKARPALDKILARRQGVCGGVLGGGNSGILEENP